MNLIKIFFAIALTSTFVSISSIEISNNDIAHLTITAKQPTGSSITADDKIINNRIENLEYNFTYDNNNQRINELNKAS